MKFIFFEKYDSRDDKRYDPIVFQESKVGVFGEPYQATAGAEPEGHGHYEGFRKRMDEQYEKGRNKYEQSRQRMQAGGTLKDEGRRMMREGQEHLEFEREKMKENRHPGGQRRQGDDGSPLNAPIGGMHCQIMRSCTKWSHGVALERKCCDNSRYVGSC